MKKIALFVGSDIFSLMIYQTLINTCKEENLQIEFIVVIEEYKSKEYEICDEMKKFHYFEKDILYELIFPFLKRRGIKSGRFLEHVTFFENHNIMFFDKISDINRISFFNYIDSVAAGVIFIRFHQNISLLYQSSFTLKNRICWEFYSESDQCNSQLTNLFHKMVNKEQKFPFIFTQFVGPRKLEIINGLNSFIDYRLSFFANQTMHCVKIALFLKKSLSEKHNIFFKHDVPSTVTHPLNEDILNDANKKGVILFDDTKMHNFFYRLFINEKDQILYSNFSKIFEYMGDVFKEKLDNPPKNHS